MPLNRSKFTQPYRTQKLPKGHELIAIAESNNAFKVRRVHGIAALNYAYVTGDADQFEWPRCEMRGLMVDEKTGEVLARPFQKFWNFNEAESRGTDWNEKHVVLPKLDGSLVYPTADRWTTRGGVTDTSLRVEKLANDMGKPLTGLLEALQTDPTDGARCTPCFEYIGPDNQIVIRYAQSQLVLLAVRRILDGNYWTTEQVRSVFSSATQRHGSHTGLRVVEPLETVHDSTTADYAARLSKDVQQWDGTREGVVVAFEPSGHRIKIKGLEYIALHRARDEYSAENRVVTVWCAGNGPALCDSLSTGRSARLTAYYEALEKQIEESARAIADEAAKSWKAHHGDRKQAAIAWVAMTHDRTGVRAAGFTAFNALARQEDAKAAASRHIHRAIELSCRQQSAYEAKALPLLGQEPPRWKPTDGNVQDAYQ